MVPHRFGGPPSRLAAVFNIQGSELIFLLLLALVILGPEKLPEAVRKFGKAYGEFKKMASGFQGELRSALDEPMREIKGTADAIRKAANLDAVTGSMGGAEPTAEATPPEANRPTPPARPTPRRDQGLNFGSANSRRQARQATEPGATADDSARMEPEAAPQPEQPEQAPQAEPTHEAADE